MKNISVFIKGGREIINFTKPIATYGSILGAKEVTVFWKFKNITNGMDNGKILIKKDPTDSSKDQEVSLGEGYWDFQQIKERLESVKLKLSMSVHDNKCAIINETGSAVDLKKFGKLLGFPENQVLPVGSTTASQNPVDVNHGLRYLIIRCDLIDSSKNIGLNGNGSDILAFLPITPGTRLNSNCYVYGRDAYAWRPARNEVVSKMEFTVESNITETVDVDILVNISLE